jgi:hypothetical protein
VPLGSIPSALFPFPPVVPTRKGAAAYCLASFATAPFWLEPERTIVDDDPDEIENPHDGRAKEEKKNGKDDFKDVVIGNGLDKLVDGLDDVETRKRKNNLQDLRSRVHPLHKFFHGVHPFPL